MIKLNKQGGRWRPYEISRAFSNEHKTASTSFAHPSHYINELSTHKQLFEQKKQCLITGPHPQLTEICLIPFRSAEMENLCDLNAGLVTSGGGLCDSRIIRDTFSRELQGCLLRIPAAGWRITPKSSISWLLLWHIADIHRIVSLPLLKYLAP